MSLSSGNRIVVLKKNLMRLPVERVLQRAVAEHKGGNLQDAERLYREILQAQPRHPDANHNLGVLSVSVDKANAALPLFKTALEANPKIEQFWLSYIDALIKLKQYDDAKQVLGRAKTKGVDADRLKPFEAQLMPKTQGPSGSSRGPSQTLINNLLRLHQERRFIDAEKLALEITKAFLEMLRHTVILAQHSGNYASLTKLWAAMAGR